MSNPNVDLETVISDSISDAQLPPEPAEVEVDTTPVEAVDAPESDPEPEQADESVSAEVTPEANSEASTSTPEAPAEDDFERLAGMPAVGALGRENRIPYSRVKKITQKAVSELAEAVVGRKLASGEKALDVVKAHVAKIPELETKVTEYESRLTKVGEFEDVMANQPKRFLQMLERVPAYQEFFTLVRQALAGQRQAPDATTQPTAQQIAEAPDDMPEPNEELPDGTKVYNMEGLKALMAWNAKQVETKVNKQWEDRYTQLEKRYQPIESEWRQRKHIESVIPVIRKQIEEAQTWPLFTENEAEITEILEADPNISLEGAYRKVVFPKLVAERNTMRREVIKEVQGAPRATAVAGSRVAAKQPAQTGPRSLEDVIKESISTLK